MQINTDEAVVYDQPTTFDEREHVAEACAVAIDLKIPTLIDPLFVDTANLLSVIWHP